MAANLRQRQILEMAQETGQVLVDDLARHFHVTAQTIRRDLGELCDSGRLERVHGGAMLNSGASHIAYDARRILNRVAKDRMAQDCAAAIGDGASVYLGIGTSVEAVAQALIHRRDLLVVTNNINVAATLMPSAGAEVIVAGGTLRPADGGLVGEMTADLVAEFKLDIAVVGASAIDGDGDLLDFDIREVRVTRTALRQCRQRFLVADHAKFLRIAPIRVASLEGFDGFFTDTPPPAPVARLCARWGTEIAISAPALEPEAG